MFGSKRGHRDARAFFGLDVSSLEPARQVSLEIRKKSAHRPRRSSYDDSKDGGAGASAPHALDPNYLNNTRDIVSAALKMATICYEALGPEEVMVCMLMCCALLATRSPEAAIPGRGEMTASKDNVKGFGSTNECVTFLRAAFAQGDEIIPTASDEHEAGSR